MTKFAVRKWRNDFRATKHILKVQSLTVWHPIEGNHAEGRGQKCMWEALAWGGAPKAGGGGRHPEDRRVGLSTTTGMGTQKAGFSDA